MSGATHRVDQLDEAFPAVPEQLGVARGVLRAWLGTHEVGRRQTEDVVLAVGEACTNAVEHAYESARPADAEFAVRGWLAGRELTITVTDQGRWRTPDPGADPFRGRGLLLMRAVMADVTLVHGDQGTTVTMRLTVD